MRFRQRQAWVLLFSGAILGLAMTEVVRSETAPSTSATLQQDVVVPPSPSRRTPAGDVQATEIPDSQPTSVYRAPSAGLVLPEGTPLPVRLTRRLSSSNNRSGDRFEAILDEDVVESSGQVLLVRGSVLSGRLENVLPGGRVSGRAEMTLVLDSVEIGGSAYPITSQPILVEAQGTRGRDARNIGIAAAIGAAVGAVLGGKKGAVVGATVGGGAGTARVMTSRGRDAEIEKEQLVTFALAQQFDIREVQPTRP